MQIPTTRRNREQFLAGQPPGVRSCFDTYFRELSARFRRGGEADSSWLRLPYWKVLPAMLWSRFGKSADGRIVRRRFLSDIQWGQYCLYLFIRFQDDVFDGQATDPVTIYASDQCLFEAERIFGKYFDRTSWFWKEYRRCLILTTQSIVEVDALQRKSTSRPAGLLEGYVKVSSILKLGSAAVCARMNKKRMYAQVSQFCDVMARVGQIWDDLYDVEEDLKRKRYNYVGNALERSKQQLLALGKSDPLLNKLRVLATIEKISFEIQTYCDAASDVIAPLKIREIDAYMNHFKSRHHVGASGGMQSSDIASDPGTRIQVERKNHRTIV